jgi:hypothetical protein
MRNIWRAKSFMEELSRPKDTRRSMRGFCIRRIVEMEVLDGAFGIKALCISNALSRRWVGKLPCTAYGVKQEIMIPRRYGNNE